jgi:hypothetical protein
VLERRRLDGWGAEDVVLTQRKFLVSPAGSHLAYAAGGGLRVLGPGSSEQIIERVGGRDVRFSADGRHLAALAAVQEEAGELARIVLLDVAGDRRRALGQVYQPRWMEWVKGGVVVSHVDPLTSRPALTYFPLAGSERQLVSRDGIEARFTAAASGTRVMFFAGGQIFTIDVTGGEPRHAGDLPGLVHNVEMAPDGSEAAIATHRALHRWRAGTTELEPLETERQIHTVWYSASGLALAFASTERATLLTGGRRHEIGAPEGNLVAMRFQRGGDGLVVVRGDQVLLWRPAAGAIRTLATSQPGHDLRGADHFRGGTVLWTVSHGDGDDDTVHTQRRAFASPPPAQDRSARAD